MERPSLEIYLYLSGESATKYLEVLGYMGDSNENPLDRG